MPPLLDLLPKAPIRTRTSALPTSATSGSAKTMHTTAIGVGTKSPDETSEDTDVLKTIAARTTRYWREGTQKLQTLLEQQGSTRLEARACHHVHRLSHDLNRRCRSFRRISNLYIVVQVKTRSVGGREGFDNQQKYTQQHLHTESV